MEAYAPEFLPFYYDDCILFAGEQRKDSALSSKDVSIQSEVATFQKSDVDYQNDEDDGNHAQNVAETVYSNLSERRKKLFDLTSKMVKICILVPHA